jgi:dynein heavy chain 2, cytosolic
LILQSCNNLLGEVPERWLQMWDGPASSTAYLRGFARKANALKHWLIKLIKKQLYDQPFALADLFHPQTFLNAFRQKVARM